MFNLHLFFLGISTYFLIILSTHIITSALDLGDKTTFLYGHRPHQCRFREAFGELEKY